MSDNLLRIGTSAILANTTLLNTTSNNIANINTEGYTRQRTEFESQILGLGVGKGTTERLVSEFTQKQLRRDTSNYNFAQQYVTEANRVDALFSNPANSIATGINDLFKQFQIANNEPATVANRQLIIGSSQALLDKFNTLSSLVLDQDNFVNQQLDIYTGEANAYIKQIADLNIEIASFGTGASRPVPLDLLDKRDLAIKNLSEMVDIRTLDADNGEKLVFLATGQSLVVERGDFSLMALRGDPDPAERELKLQLSSRSSVERDIDIDLVGGKIGGLLSFREEILVPTQNRLGQLALSMTDALNTQNRLGMDLNGKIGGNLFTLPVSSGFALSDNTGTGNVDVTIEPGQGGSLPPNDFLLTVEAGGVRIQALDSAGKVVAGSDKVVAVGGYPATINSADAGGDLYGLEITLSAGLAVGDQFELKPLSTASRTVQMATTRPEDIALAAPVRTEFTVNNIGNAQISDLTVTDTTPATLPAYGFDTPSGLINGPWTMTYVGGNSFEIVDNLGNPVATSTYPSGQYQDIFAQAGVDVGFDFSVSGVPNVGDTFTISFNDGGFNDNRNGLALSAIQTEQTTRLNPLSSPTGTNSVNFNQSYAQMVSLIGERTSQGRNSEAATGALLAQTTAWYESLSGVSLDEEASNLVRFQQTYAAAARIISTSQTVFDTLLAAAR
ncbi:MULTISPECIES: flagellar hook-associated protein FlgK [Rheinheimera]|jgi:flagellar hook-associated protein 1 FlgK|uniref:flagellar hook-associated protein FlgK n=1 Tax=Rheinheimera TaxID=67575 RepID=UPI001065F205|nr:MULTISPECIES: flagellar hook-associated protein FlgK [Rheinheimera]MCD1600438.1 flagellar hook-associated protein FlgK [Rheinheimera aquimaris]|tara:strand:+ start:586 stop:2604 length:2019 start_codon:yes stop_codon:yes gene_type:complete